MHIVYKCSAFTRKYLSSLFVKISKANSNDLNPCKLFCPPVGSFTPYHPNSYFDDNVVLTLMVWCMCCMYWLWVDWLRLHLVPLVLMFKVWQENNKEGQTGKNNSYLGICDRLCLGIVCIRVVCILKMSSTGLLSRLDAQPLSLFSEWM